MQTKAYAVHSATTPFAPFSIDRREPGPKDVAIEILYCGVCHSDLHTARGEWPGVLYPCVPGHEIIGKVTKIGSEVTRFNPARLSGSAAWSTAAAPVRHARTGWSNIATALSALPAPITARSAAAPTPMAAIARPSRWTSISCSTSATPKKTWPRLRRCSAPASPPGRRCATGARAPARRSASSGIGGLGHMGVKLAHALGAHTVAFTTSPDKDRRRQGAGRRRSRGVEGRRPNGASTPTAST